MTTIGLADGTEPNRAGPDSPDPASAPSDGASALGAPLSDTGANGAELVLAERLEGRWDRIEELLSRAGEWLNPILVKETRQAIKSRQFTVTFALVLIACWAWTLGGVAWIGPSIFYSPHGVDMFFGYFIILAFPLAVIVPFTAYRSLAGEREENTFELLSIATLTPGQIISGKLWSAVVQILVYFSAVAPCLAFTFLLRGIDIVSIGVLLAYAFLASLGLSAIGLLLATTARERYGQVILSVALVIGLTFTFFFGVGGTAEFLTWGGPLMMQPEYWIVNGVLATIYVTYFILVYLAAAARVTFASENRSTKLRIAMLFQQFCFTAWMAWPWLAETPRFEVTTIVGTIYVVVLAVHWYVMGAFMTGESPELSKRVQRSLPQSFLGRVFGTWFFPGPGTGYMFALSNQLAALMLVLVGLQFVLGSTTPMWGLGRQGIIWGAVLTTAYMVFYLGLGKWLIGLLRKAFALNLFTGLLIHALLLILGTGVPLIIYGMSTELGDYTLLQLTNPFWSVYHVLERGSVSQDAIAVATIMSVLAAVTLLLNLRSIATELGYTRIARPQRVEEEDAELSPTAASEPQSPWD